MGQGPRLLILRSWVVCVDFSTACVTARTTEHRPGEELLLGDTSLSRPARARATGCATELAHPVAQLSSNYLTDSLAH